MKQKQPLRDFIQEPNNGRIALIVANELVGGVYRGHAIVWYGETKDNRPVLHMECMSGWEQLPIDFLDV